MKPTTGESESTSDCWSDLIIAMLAVNRYSIEKAYSLVANLRANGLLDPLRLAEVSEAEVAAKLSRSGYDRGNFLNRLIASRLIALGEFVKSHGRDQCENVLGSGTRKGITSLLSNVKGIGPTVLDTFFLLQNVKR